MRDMTFVTNELPDLQGVVALQAYREMTPDLMAAVFDAAGKFANPVWAPLNQPAASRERRSWNKKGVTAVVAAERREYVLRALPHPHRATDGGARDRPVVNQRPELSALQDL
jgi:hypothetical protein